MIADTRNRLSKTINDKYITILINYEPAIAHNVFSFTFEPELTSFSEDIGSEYETLDADDYVDRMGDYLEEFLDYDIEAISSFTLKDLAVFSDSPLFDTIKRSKLNIQFQRSGFRLTCSYTLEIYDSNFNKGLIEELEEELENTIPLAFENSLGAHEDISTEISGYMVEYSFDVNLVI